MISDLFYRLHALFRPKSMEAEFDEELRAHFEHQVEKCIQSGVAREEAARLVLAKPEEAGYVVVNHSMRLNAQVLSSLAPSKWEYADSVISRGSSTGPPTVKWYRL